MSARARLAPVGSENVEVSCDLSAMDSRLCAFVPLRDSVATDPRRMLALTEDHAATLLNHPEQALDPALWTASSAPRLTRHGPASN